ncbi:hypothetical protein BGX26_002474 [Mortierella sp. AD094]|nr:hypothetical protein BGX26_002474 [Mortierella sp. AD094]
MATIDQPSIPFYQQRKPVPPPTVTLPTAALSRTPSQFSSPVSSPSLLPSPFKDSFSQKAFLPRAALSSSPDHGTNFQQLLFFKECFHKREFWDECTILDRMYYKNKSQHRQAGYFQRLCECRRIISRIRELDITGLVDELVKKFFSGNSLRTVAGARNQWDSIPYRSTVTFTMTRIIGAILLMKKMQITLHETYGAFYQLMSKTQFMPFALIAIGLCSRLSLVSKAWMSELADCYILLCKWIKSFPKEETPMDSIDYESQLPESIESVIATNTPDILEIPIPSMPAQTTEQLLIEGADLGEIIQRVERSSPPGVSLIPTPQYQPRHSLSSLSKTKPGYDSSDSNLDSDDIGAALEENAEPIRPSVKPKKAKAPEVLSDLDHIFNEEKTQKIKSKKKLNKPSDFAASGTSSAPQPSLGVKPKNKNKAGSATNFDDIFNFDRDTSVRAGSSPSSPGEPKATVLPRKSGKGKREIDDIFGAIKKPIKKPKGSEIDDIFGAPAQKKRK